MIKKAEGDIILTEQFEKKELIEKENGLNNWKTYCHENLISLTPLFFNNNRYMLNRALEKKDLEYLIVPYFQEIKRNTSEGDTNKYETLFRLYKKEEKGYKIIGPSILEDEELNEVLLDKVLLELVHSVKDIIGDNYKISFNFTESNILSPGMAMKIKKILEDSNLKPSNFIIEVLESVKDSELVREKLKEFKTHGFEIAIDDFGPEGFTKEEIKEYKELDLIKYVKIDRFYFQENKNKNTFKEIISYFINIGLEIIVEGVETFEEQKIVKELGVSYTQGYYFGKPKPAKEII